MERCRTDHNCTRWRPRFGAANRNFAGYVSGPKSNLESNIGRTVTWRNSAYKSLGATLGFCADTQHLFDTSGLKPGDPSQKFKLSSSDGTSTHWFNVTAVRAGKDTMYYATEADAEVSAQDARRSFVQTFSNTFAQLSTGLAIFDQNRKLVLFNPALTELTGLSADFLSNQCDLFSFFDQLREHQAAP